jgi:hypothetical protein
MESLLSDIPAGKGKTANLFYSVVNWRKKQRAKQKKRTFKNAYFKDIDLWVSSPYSFHLKVTVATLSTIMNAAATSR